MTTPIRTWSDEDGDVYVSGTMDKGEASKFAREYLEEVEPVNYEGFQFSDKDNFEWWNPEVFSLGDERVPPEMVSKESKEGWVPVLRKTIWY